MLGMCDGENCVFGFWIVLKVMEKLLMMVLDDFERI